MGLGCGGRTLLESIPIGKGKITREGNAATLVSYGRSLLFCNQVADQLKEQGRYIEVIDLRSLYPYDWQMVKHSVLKTKRVLFVNEDTEVTNFGEHLAYRATTEMFYELHARPRVLAGKNIPGVGLHQNLEKATVPQLQDILRECLDLLDEAP